MSCLDQAKAEQHLPLPEQERHFLVFSNTVFLLTLYMWDMNRMLNNPTTPRWFFSYSLIIVPKPPHLLFHFALFHCIPTTCLSFFGGGLEKKFICSNGFSYWVRQLKPLCIGGV